MVPLALRAPEARAGPPVIAVAPGTREVAGLDFDGITAAIGVFPAGGRVCGVGEEEVTGVLATIGRPVPAGTPIA